MSEPLEHAEPVLPRWKKVTFSLILVAFVLGIFEGAAQVYLRVARGYAGSDFLQYEFDPYKNIQLQRNWVDTRGVRHNAQGFRRDEDVSRTKAEGTYRVMLMGASTAYGLGGLFPHIQTEFAVLDNSETIDAYLEPILTEALPYERVEVINTGIPSIWTHHHLIYLNQAILGYDPDMILFLDGFNDHYIADRSHDQFAKYAQTETQGVIMGPPTISALVRMNAWWFFRRSAFVHVAARSAQELKTVLSNQEGPSAIRVEEAVENVQWVFEQNALRMIERNALILQHEEIPTLFMLQPLLVLEADRLDQMPAIERELFEFNAGWQENYESFMVRSTPIIAEMINEAVTPLGGEFLDLTGIYQGVDGQIFTDYAHLTPLGNRILAEHVAEKIVEMAAPPADSEGR